MNKEKKYVLSIAGFDPSAGAGVLADIKTFEACGVYGLGVCSALTYQNDISFEGLKWMNVQEIINQIKPLQARFNIEVIKIGLIENIETLLELSIYLKVNLPDCKIIWDPILKATAGFTFHNAIDQQKLHLAMSNIYLVTPNWNEASQLAEDDNALTAATILSNFTSVYLKGGHSDEAQAVDRLFLRDDNIKLEEATTKKTYNNITYFEHVRLTGVSKHGSGCVLSSAIAAHLALTNEIVLSCDKAKKYITNYLQSTDDLLGFHFMN